MTLESLTIDELEQWALSGGHWRVVAISTSRVLVDMCACTGEAMQRAGSEDPDVIAWIRTAPNRDED